MGHHQLDNLDYKILKLIASNARIPFLEVARECNVSGAAIHQRVQKLTNLGIIKGSEFTIHMKVRFMADLPAPIFAFSIKTVKGTEITGTNTMFEKAFLEPVKAGAVKDITFTQKMSLQGGEYLLSFGVTGYDGNDFQVYHRLYDALDLTVISDKNTVGFYDMDSKVIVKDAE